MRILLQLPLFFLISVAMQAQSTFTQHVRKQGAGEGKVVIVQDTLIDSIVNNVRREKGETAQAVTRQKGSNSGNAASKKAQNGDGIGGMHEKAADTTYTYTARQRYKANGYRIQIYTGSNSHRDKMKAYELGEKCQKKFPMLSVYPRFISPRWVCRVGDFATHEDAQEYAQKIREARLSTEVRIVKCEVLLAK